MMNQNDRKTIKQKSIEEPKGTLTKVLVCILVIWSVINLVFIYILKINYGNNIVSGLSNFINLIILSPFILNFMNLFLLNSKDELYSFNDFFQKPKRALKYALVFTIISLPYQIIANVIALVSHISIILNIILSIVVIPFFIFLPLVYLENENTKIKQLIVKTIKVIKGHYIEFYALIISFFFWYLLSIATLGLLFLWLIPYIIIALTYQYQKWAHKEKFVKQKSLSNYFIIIIFLILMIVLSITS